MLIPLETKCHIHYFIIRLSQLVKQIKDFQQKRTCNVHRKETNLCVSRYVTLRWSFNPNLSHYILTTCNFAKYFDIDFYQDVWWHPPGSFIWSTQLLYLMVDIYIFFTKNIRFLSLLLLPVKNVSKPQTEKLFSLTHIIACTTWSGSI